MCQGSESNGSSLGGWGLDRIWCVLKGFTREAVRGQKQSLSVFRSGAPGVKQVSLAVLT